MIYVVEYLSFNHMKCEYFKNMKDAMKFIKNEISEANFLALYKSDNNLSAEATNE